MSRQKGKVLVIEDDSYARDALARVLKAEGYDAQLADDGESGLDKAHQEQPDIIILDLSLPGIDGRQVIHHIRNDGSLRSTPILVVTGHDPEVAQAAVDLGADGYLTKPVEIEDLIHKISAVQSRTTAHSS